MAELRFNRYRFVCRVLEPLALNDYSGSMLRGAFGWALKKTVCMTKMHTCRSYLLQRQCLYPQIFEPPSVHSAFQHLSQKPVPYIIEPPPMGKRTLEANQPFSFNMVLIGPAIDALPVLIHAWQQALARGLGKQHNKARLEQVIFEPGQPVERCLYQHSEGQLQAVPDYRPAPLNPTETLQLTLTSPLRLKSQGKLCASTLTGEEFIKALFRRYYLLQECYTANYQPPDFKHLSEQAHAVSATVQLRWYHWSRYSNRQQQSMPLGGVIGQIRLTGPLHPFLTLLQHGQWLHVGNKTSFGLGGYRLEKAR